MEINKEWMNKKKNNEKEIMIIRETVARFTAHIKKIPKLNGHLDFERKKKEIQRLKKYRV